MYQITGRDQPLNAGKEQWSTGPDRRRQRRGEYRYRNLGVMVAENCRADIDDCLGHELESSANVRSVDGHKLRPSCLARHVVFLVRKYF
jgi:hypothetical protein